MAVVLRSACLCDFLFICLFRRISGNSSAVAEKRRYTSVRLSIICSTVMVGPIVRLIIYNTDVSDRKSGKEVFEKSAQAGFQLGTYGTASHRVIIPPWNQH